MIIYIVVFIIAFILGFIVGMLFAKRNPKLTEKVNDAYLKGKQEAEKELREKFNQAQELIKSKTGSIEVPQINISALKKYFLRFGPSLALLIYLIALFQPDKIVLVMYKLCLVLIAIILAEFVWMLSYKTVFGKIEETKPYDKRSILIFRGILYAAIVLAVCLGL